MTLACWFSKISWRVLLTRYRSVSNTSSNSWHAHWLEARFTEQLESKIIKNPLGEFKFPAPPPVLGSENSIDRKPNFPVCASGWFVSGERNLCLVRTEKHHGHQVLECHRPLLGLKYPQSFDRCSLQIRFYDKPPPSTQTRDLESCSGSLNLIGSYLLAALCQEIPGRELVWQCPQWSHDRDKCCRTRYDQSQCVKSIFADVSSETADVSFDVEVQVLDMVPCVGYQLYPVHVHRDRG